MSWTLFRNVERQARRMNEMMERLDVAPPRWLGCDRATSMRRHAICVFSVEPAIHACVGSMRRRSPANVQSSAQTYRCSRLVRGKVGRPDFFGKWSFLRSGAGCGCKKTRPVVATSAKQIGNQGGPALLSYGGLMLISIAKSMPTTGSPRGL